MWQGRQISYFPKFSFALVTHHFWEHQGLISFPWFCICQCSMYDQIYPRGESSFSSLLALSILKNIVTSHWTVEYNMLVLETALELLIHNKHIFKKLLHACFFLHDLGYFYFNISSQLSTIVLNWFQFFLGTTSQNIQTTNCNWKLPTYTIQIWEEKIFWHLFKIYFSHQNFSGLFPPVSIFYQWTIAPWNAVRTLAICVWM